MVLGWVVTVDRNLTIWSEARNYIECQRSSWKDVLSGVSQGSVGLLGPILFWIYINNIDESVACKVLKFADDTKIYRVVNSQEDIESLRNDFEEFGKMVSRLADAIQRWKM